MGMTPAVCNRVRLVLFAYVVARTEYTDPDVQIGPGIICGRAAERGQMTPMQARDALRTARAHGLFEDDTAPSRFHDKRITPLVITDAGYQLLGNMREAAEAQGRKRAQRFEDAIQRTVREIGG